jgi:serine/threonine-protein kinase RsbW
MPTTRRPRRAPAGRAPAPGARRPRPLGPAGRLAGVRPDADEALPLNTFWCWEARPATEAVGPVLDFVAESMAAAGYGEEEVFGVRLAVEEAVSNAIRHGHRGDLGKPVRVCYHVDARRALVEVEDEGDGFDPARVPDPRDPESRARPGGRGLLLMRAHLSWVRHHGRGNRVTLCKYRSGG